MKIKNLISISDISKNEIDDILNLAYDFESGKYQNILKNKVISSVFFEDSTRTRLSFETAINQLGGSVIGFSSSVGTSINKGETLSDTIKMISRYSDLIVMRHNWDGAARWASCNSNVPVVNAGDGSNQHPSQTLLDLYTIKKEFKKLNNLKIAIVGDLKYGRTAHSLTIGLSYYNPELFFVSPTFLKIPETIKDSLINKKIKFHEINSIENIIDEVDVIYITRLQKERFSSIDEYEKVKDYFILSTDLISNAKKTMIILHPLPRVNEIPVEIDDTIHARYFEQAKNGVHVRKAIIANCLDIIKDYQEQKYE
ncbi:MAG: aspartate carbamoyltransferase [Mycoplasmoidaceae bacterium]